MPEVKRCIRLRVSIDSIRLSWRTESECQWSDGQLYAENQFGADAMLAEGVDEITKLRQALQALEHAVLIRKEGRP